MLRKSTVKSWLHGRYQNIARSFNILPEQYNQREYDRIIVRQFPSPLVSIRKDARNIGRIADISLGGFRLTSATAIDAGKTFSLQIIIPLSGDYTSKIDIDACSVWCEDRGDDYFDTGFHFNKLSNSTRDRLEQIITVLGADFLVGNEGMDIALDDDYLDQLWLEHFADIDLVPDS